MNLDGLVQLGVAVVHCELDPSARTEDSAMARMKAILVGRGQWPVECSTKWDVHTDPSEDGVGPVMRTCTVFTYVPALPEDERSAKRRD